MSFRQSLFSSSLSPQPTLHPLLFFFSGVCFAFKAAAQTNKHTKPTGNKLNLVRVPPTARGPCLATVWGGGFASAVI